MPRYVGQRIPQIAVGGELADDVFVDVRGTDEFTAGFTNTFSGEAFEFFRDKALNRMNMFEQERHDQLGTPKPDFRRHQYGATFGGPVVRDRVHVLVAGDLTETTDFVTVNTGKPQFYSSIEGTASNDQFRRMFFSRADTQLNAAQSAFPAAFQAPIRPSVSASSSPAGMGSSCPSSEIHASIIDRVTSAWT